MKKQPDMNITPGTDKFLRLHIDDLSQPIRRSAYAPPAKPLAADKASRVFTMFSALVVVMGALAIITILSK